MNKLPLGTISYIQTMLREISRFDPKVTSIIPDGIFGEQTKESVSEFQKLYGLYDTGEVDNDTWDKIVEVYENIQKEKNAVVFLQVFDEKRKAINIGEHRAELYVIQAMITALSEKLDNISSLFVSGTYDEPTAEEVKKIQLLSGITPNDCIDAEFINSLTELYNVYVTRNRVQNFSV